MKTVAPVGSGVVGSVVAADLGPPLLGLDGFAGKAGVFVVESSQHARLIHLAFPIEAHEEVLICGEGLKPVHVVGGHQWT